MKRSLWNSVTVSVTGSSHRENGQPCQDSSAISTVRHKRQDSLIAVCSDGAGSASHAEEGSRTACEAGIAQAKAFVESHGLDAVSHAVVLDWCVQIRQALEARAFELEAKLGDLHCTFLLAILGHESSVFVQIGDGAMVIDGGEGFEAIFWPQAGEFAGMTNFITSPDLESCVNFQRVDQCVKEFAAFTDGLERLALAFHNKTVHSPFFSPMFEKLESMNDVAEYQEGLRKFLGSKTITERTDDDTTLVLAIRRSRDSLWGRLQKHLSVVSRNSCAPRETP